MRFSGLVVHGWSALSVYGEVVSVRLLLAGLGLSGVAAGLLAAALCLRLGTALAVPGWALYALASLLVLVVEGLVGASVLGFVLIGGRSNTSFLPIRDAHYFIMETVRMYPRE